MEATKTRPASSAADRRPRDPVTRYARRVVDGKVIAGPLVRAACARHLRDLDAASERGLRWSPSRAQYALDFFPHVLCLNGGEYEGKPFELLGWQAFIVGSLFGWLHAADDTRRFRIAYVETAKGSGKSPLAAGIGMLGLVADGESRAEIYAAATKKDQAMVLFRDAVAMWQQSPELNKRLTRSGTGENSWNLAYRSTASFFRPISADDGQSGPRPHIALIDEIHEHRTNVVVEFMRAGTKSRRQAMILMITNSGSAPTSPCGQYHEYARKVVHGLATDDSFFGFVCSLDEGDDPINDESCWPKANPSLQEVGLPGHRYLREQVREARGMPSKEALVRRLNFCQWTQAENPWLSPDIWFAAQRDFDWREFAGRRAYAGLDLSSTTDLTGLVLAVEPLADGDPWHLVPFAFMPEADIERREQLDRVPYRAWIKAGHLETTPGRAISKLQIVRKLADLSRMFDIVAVGFDRWRMEDLVALASDAQIELPTMHPCGQGFKDMTIAIEAFETELLAGRVVHAGHPVLNWCAANAVPVTDDAGNRKLSKSKATGRIDLVIAALMAFGVASIRQEPDLLAGYFDYLRIKGAAP